jgi:hypothetical protein
LKRLPPLTQPPNRTESPGTMRATVAGFHPRHLCSSHSPTSESWSWPVSSPGCLFQSPGHLSPPHPPLRASSCPPEWLTEATPQRVAYCGHLLPQSVHLSSPTGWGRGAVEPLKYPSTLISYGCCKKNSSQIWCSKAAHPLATLEVRAHSKSHVPKPAYR